VYHQMLFLLLTAMMPLAFLAVAARLLTVQYIADF
jgi:hypothetical protein